MHRDTHDIRRTFPSSASAALLLIAAASVVVGCGKQPASVAQAPAAVTPATPATSTPTPATASGGAIKPTAVDCASAASFYEKTVCSNSELAKKDNEVGKAYNDYLDRLKPSDQEYGAIRTEARAFESELQDCQTVECLRKAYADRLESLK